MKTHIYTCVFSSLLIAALLITSTQLIHAQSVTRDKAQIVVGPTVQVSKALSQLPHYENLAAGDPGHPGRLITCSMVYANEVGKLIWEQCYLSSDGGKTWEPSLRVSEGHVNGDPTVIYGRNEEVYVVALVSKDPDKPRDPSPDAPRFDMKTVIYKSADGGRKWEELSRFQFIDREYIAIDKTNGKYDGRIYVVGQSTAIKTISGSSRPALQMFRSIDHGKTFLGPLTAEYPEGSGLCGVGTSAVLSDGTFVGVFGITKPGRQMNLEQEPLIGPNCELHMISSKDGGETFSKSEKIADLKLDRKRSEGGMIGQLAVDPGSEPFKDRLYVVWPNIIAGRIQIQLSYSSDRGKTWSKPTIVNDDRSPEEQGSGPDHLLPSIAVNMKGVVFVTWYDRREANDNIGWKVRGAASLDGGETFSASVPLTDVGSSYSQTTPWDVWADGTIDDRSSLVSLRIGINPFFFSGGHTSGLAVDATGTFHPTWIDNRTGVAQIWSAPVRIDGTVVNHGTTDLAKLDDVSKSVTLELSKPTFDRSTGILNVTAQLKNTSPDIVESPVKVRVLTLESEIGLPEIVNADNGRNGTGAVWDFSMALAQGRLPSMATSTPRTLTFRLSQLRTLGQGKDFKFRLLNLDARVFGKLRKENTNGEKAASEQKPK
jgi:hypothetical protein